MYVWEYGNKLKDIVTKLTFDCSVIGDSYLTAPMSYRPIDNTIRYNLGRVQGIGMKRGFLFQDTFFCLGYHEIGHYIDFKNNPELHSNLKERMTDPEFVYDREEQAYVLGRKLIESNKLLVIYDSLNNERLEKLKQKMKGFNYNRT
ncbi:hypothetical protein D1872_211460 [compost metagenome]